MIWPTLGWAGRWQGTFQTKMRSWFSYGSLVMSASVLSLIKMFAYAKFLNVEDFGVVALVLASYAVALYIGTLGVSEGLLKLASMEQNLETKVALASSAVVAAMMFGFVSAALGIAISAFAAPSAPMALVLSVTFLCICALAFRLIEIIVRAGQQFRLFSLLIFIKAALSLAVALVLIYIGQPKMVLLGEGVVFLLATGAAALFLEVRPRFRLAERGFGLALVRHGLPMAFSNLAKKLTFTADRWLVALLAGPVANAEYGFAMLVYLGAISLIGVANTAVGPMLLSRAGADGSMRQPLGSFKLIGYLFAALVVFVTSVYLIYPVLLSMFFPAYDRQEVVLSVTMVAAGMGATAFASFAEWFLIGQHRSYALTLINSITLVVTLALFFWIAFYGYSLERVCMAFAVMRWINLGMILFAIGGSGPRERTA